MPGTMTAHARLLIDGDRFRTESPEATYDGVFTIDADAKPRRIDIEFVEGPADFEHPARTATLSRWRRRFD